MTRDGHFWICAFSVTAACGSRTPFDVAPDAPQSSVIITDVPCSTDAECSDAIACTLDACDPKTHVCTRALRDAMCDDGLYCDGVERCDVRAGCIPSPSPADCSDAVACTIDTCDEERRLCLHKTDDRSCPISHVCDPTLGCQVRALAHDSTRLYDVRLPSGEVKVIGATGSALTDVALHPSNVLYGVSLGSLFVVDQMTGSAKVLGSIDDIGGANAADIAPDGTLYVAGDSSLFTVDTATGTATRVMAFPKALTSSGDLAFLGTRLVATARDGGSDMLVEFDLAAGLSKVLGPIGFRCVWGLASYGTTLYGLTCNGEVLSIDGDTGKGVVLNKSSVAFWGASAR